MAGGAIWLTWVPQISSPEVTSQSPGLLFSVIYLENSISFNWILLSQVTSEEASTCVDTLGSLGGIRSAIRDDRENGIVPPWPVLPPGERSVSS